MTSVIFSFLKSYSTEPRAIDRLIVSSFLQFEKRSVKRNKFLKSFIVTEESSIEYENVLKFSKLLEKHVFDFHLENLIELFEFVISPSDRQINGAIYTPLAIRNFITRESFRKFSEWPLTYKIADISCGCGGFLINAAKEIRKRTSKNYTEIFKNYIYGLDIQSYSVNRCKLLLSIFALIEGEDEDFQFNIFEGDALVFDWSNKIRNFQGFNLILGNPPYVCARNLDLLTKQNLKKWIVSTSGNPDLYIPFFQIGFENLAPKGVLGYITMNTFFKSLNGRSLRKYFSDNKISLKIIDFGTIQIFKSKSTYTCICILENRVQNHIGYFRSKVKDLTEVKVKYHHIPYSSLEYFKGWNLNNNEIISTIESIGKSLGEVYKTRHGIATLRNDIFIFKPVFEDSEYYYLQNDINYPIEKGICRDILNSNRLSRKVSEKDLMEKIIFPYTSEDKPKLIKEKYFQVNYPKAYDYLFNKKEDLAKRDKGHGNYPAWYAFGRTQSLESFGNKLFFPKFSDRIPSYLISLDKNLLFYNGQAIVGHSKEEMLFIKRILESHVFWYYIRSSSKPYTSQYYSFNGTYLKNFGIPNFDPNEIDIIINSSDTELVNRLIEEKYGFLQLDEALL